MAATAVALQQVTEVARPANASHRAELLTRYRRLRAIGKQHNTAILKFIGKNAIMSQARRLGLAQGKTLVLDSWDEMNLVFDLLIYTAPIDRSRAVDRYARSVQLTPGSDEAIVLEAMRQAQFSIITCVRRHAIVGLVVEDLFRKTERWLIDEGLESSLPSGATLATRLFTLDGFDMTAGVMVPVDDALIRKVIADTPQLVRKSTMAIVDDRRFAEAIYRTGVMSGIMDQVAYRETSAA